MRKKSLVFAVLLGILFYLNHLAVAQSQGVKINGNLRVVHLEGSPYERGLKHGQTLKKEIHDLVKLWKANLEESRKTDADVYIKKFVERTEFHKAIKKWTPELWAELKGISEGSGIEFDTMYAFQLVDEEWVLGQQVLSEHCTTIGAKKTMDSPAFVAQNLDIPGFYHGFQTLLHVIDSQRDMETFLFTFPGFIAANGLNNSSVGVVVNAVTQLENSRDGLPVAFVIRGILQRKTFAEAVKFIRSIKHGAPQNYMIGGPEKIGSFECATTNVSEFIPFEGAKFTYHTNHPLKNQNYTAQFFQFLEKKNLSPGEYEFPCSRFKALQEKLKDNSATLDLDVVKSIFSDRDTFINNAGTFGCTIMVLGKTPELHISPGRPDIEPFQVYRFAKK